MTQEYIVELDIYPLEKLQQSVEIFQEYGDLSLQEGEDSSKIGIVIDGEDEEEIETLFGELMNYTLAL